MSFILDALKKSETDRQQQGPAEFSSVPTGSEKPNPTRWLWMLAALLGVNFAVLIGILMRPETAPSDTVAEETTEATAPVEMAPVETATFEEKIADAIEDKKKSPPSAPPPVQS